METVCLLLLFAGLQAASGQAKQEAPMAAADGLLREGIAAQQRHDLTAAIDDYRKALSIRPELAEARANLGAALAAVGRFDEAIDEDTRALAVASDKVSVRRNLGLAYYKKGDMTHAHDAFAVVHAARPQDLSTTMLLGYTEIKLGKGAEAVAMLSPMEAGQESNMDFEYVLGCAQIQSGKEDQGMPRMEKVAAATHSAEAWVIAGDARMRKYDFVKARDDLDAALKLDPNLPGLKTLTGKARDSVGDQAGAVPLFQAALRNDPLDFDANLYLGAIKLKERDVEAATPLLQKALELRPDAELARFEKAKLDSVTGNYQSAAAALEDIAGKDPNWLAPHVELASIYYKLHRPDDGKRERDIVQQIEASQQKKGPPPP